MMKSLSKTCFCGQLAANKHTSYCTYHRRDYAKAYKSVYYAKNKKACIDDVNKRNKEVYNYKHQKTYSKNNVFAIGMYNHFKRLEK